MSFTYRNWPKTFGNEMVYMKCIETNASSIALTAINNSMENVYSNTNYCGVNANFFYNTSDPEYLSNNYEYLDIYTLGINNHSSIKNHGDVNLIGQNQDGDRGTFIVYDWSCQEKCSR